MVFQRPQRTFIMVRIPAGEFFMGSLPGHGEADEFPRRQVFLDAYLIGRYPVTAAEWAAFLNQAGRDVSRYFEMSSETTVTWFEDGWRPRRGCSRHPANGVTWYGAEAYCQWLATRTGRPFRLPTEAEWEKASRGGLEGQRYPWGNTSPDGQAWFGHTWRGPKHTLAPVGLFPPNGYGLHDMVGGVWEWCSDWYDRNYYHESPPANPKGPESGDSKVVRGGSWGGLDVQIRCAIRVGEDPAISDSRVGFRVARSEAD